MMRKSDGEDDIALVNVANAAASSLFSPNMWVRRPVRTPRFDASDIYEANAHRFPDGLQTARKGAPTPSHKKNSNTASRAKRSRDDQDLSYLEAQDRDGAEQEQIEQDLAQIAAIEAEILRTEQLRQELAIEYRYVASKLNKVKSQNASVKRMFAALGVIKDDFDLSGATDEPSRKRRMIEIGQRLVKSLTEQSPQQKVVQPPRGRGRPPLNPPAHTPATTLNGKAASHVQFTPPAQYPVESQIAAASLTLARGDPAVAYLSLLEKALSARTPAMAPHFKGEGNDDPNDGGALRTTRPSPMGGRVSDMHAVPTAIATSQ